MDTLSEINLMDGWITWRGFWVVMCWASSLCSWICLFTGWWIPACANSSRVTGDARSRVGETVDVSCTVGSCNDAPLLMEATSCARSKSATLIVDVEFCCTDGCWRINCSCCAAESMGEFCTPAALTIELWLSTFCVYIVVVPHAVLAFANPARSNASTLRLSSTSASCLTADVLSSWPSNSSLLRDNPGSWLVNDAKSDTANRCIQNVTPCTTAVYSTIHTINSSKCHGYMHIAEKVLNRSSSSSSLFVIWLDSKAWNALIAAQQNTTEQRRIKPLNILHTKH